MDRDAVLKACGQFTNTASFGYRVCKLIRDGDFSDVVSSQELTRMLNEGPGKNIDVSALTSCMSPLQRQDIVRVKIIGQGSNKRKFWFPGWVDKRNVEFRLSGTPSNAEQLFSKVLVSKLGSRFEIDLTDLAHVYGRSGTCTAFLLRKILEKLIFLSFAKNGRSNLLKDANGDYVGLKKMIALCTTNTVSGVPFLMPKTADELLGVKFLGDTSAHNPLINVDMKTIIPQMPFIIVAYEELSNKL